MEPGDPTASGWPTPYTDVNIVLRAFLEGTRAILGECFTGMYLTGSLALGDFNNERSDIDFLVVGEVEVTGAELQALQALHARFNASDSPWATEVEAVYISRQALRRHDPAHAVHPHIQRGLGENLVPDTLASDWVVQRRVMREHGVALAGPDLRGLIDPVSPDDMRQAVVALMAIWWDPMLGDPAPLRRRGYQAYSVLTMCRMLYTLSTGDVVTKSAAARWVQRMFGARMHALIDRALAWRKHHQDDLAAAELDETLELIRYTRGRCLQFERARPTVDAYSSGRRLRAQLAATMDDGYFGPASAMWHMHREAALGFGLGRALLLQLAHPLVAQSIKDHSAFREQPLDRLLATVIAAELLIFGDRAQADAAADRIRHVHAHISGVLPEAAGVWRAGTAYSAGDADALLWVLVTLLDTSIAIYEACLGRLSDRMLRAYLHEGARLGALLGVPIQGVPADRAALAAYMRSTIDDGTVEVGHAAREVAAALLNTHVVPGPAWRVYSAVTHYMAARMLPAPLARHYGPILDRRYTPLFRAAAPLARAVWPRLPERVRLDPIAAIAVRRAAARAAIDRRGLLP